MSTPLHRLVGGSPGSATGGRLFFFFFFSFFCFPSQYTIYVQQTFRYTWPVGDAIGKYSRENALLRTNITRFRCNQSTKRKSCSEPFSVMVAASMVVCV